MSVCLCVCLIVRSVFTSLSRQTSQQRAPHHSPFHPSCPRSRCHGHRPSGQECSADYHSDIRSQCTSAELRGSVIALIKNVTSSKCAVLFVYLTADDTEASGSVHEGEWYRDY